ncbi:MAG TPA: tyrosine-type recombinase/integrase [Thermoanaerobaculia bacterium]|nr:tyrosine-type recombinase/integrase [Thermoanaerobaculia bacterium]
MERRLTEAVIPALRTTKAQEEVYHSGTPSAGIRVTRDGAKTFFIRYRSPTLKGKDPDKPALRRFYFGEHRSGRPGEARYFSLKEFETAYAVFRGQLAQGVDPQPPASRGSGSAHRLACPAPAEEALKLVPADCVPVALRKLFPRGYAVGSISALLADYFEHHGPHLAGKTVRGYQETAAKHVIPRFGFVPILSLTTQDVRRALTEVSQSVPQMARQVKKVLSAAFEYAITHVPGVAVNPCLGVKITVPRGRRDRWLNDEELATILDTLPKLADQKAADAYRLMLCAAVRPCEAASVQAEDIVTMGGERMWQLRGTKMDRDFLVPLVGPVGEILNRRYLEVGGKGPLFWKASPLGRYPAAMQSANRELRVLSGLADIRPHDFRRTARTHFSALGVAEAVAEALLNHAKGEIEATYNLYTYWPERKHALSLWHSKLASLTKEKTEAA